MANNKEVIKAIKAVVRPRSLISYVKEHREEIDAQLKQYIPNLKRPNDQDRINWIRITKGVL